MKCLFIGLLLISNGRRCQIVVNQHWRVVNERERSLFGKKNEIKDVQKMFQNWQKVKALHIREFKVCHDALET